jgi:hypothetical protein
VCIAQRRPDPFTGLTTTSPFGCPSDDFPVSGNAKSSIVAATERIARVDGQGCSNGVTMLVPKPAETFDTGVQRSFHAGLSDKGIELHHVPEA